VLLLFTEYFIILKKLQGKKGISTARPRQIDLEHGVVYLQNFPTDVANALQAHIEAFKYEATAPKTVTTTTESIAPTQQHPNKAVGVRTYRDPIKDLMYSQIVTVGFDVEANKADIIKVEQVNEPRELDLKFKMTCFDLGFIR
jgi:hypothetical protein